MKEKKLLKQFELLNSVLTPDVGHAVTFLINSPKEDLPYFDKSQPLAFETSAYGVSFNYKEKDLFIPWHNIRYITSDK